MFARSAIANDPKSLLLSVTISVKRTLNNVVVSTNKNGRKIYILPQWKEEGLHGGLKFSLKEWNPDLLSGMVFTIFPREGAGELALVIGAVQTSKLTGQLTKPCSRCGDE